MNKKTVTTVKVDKVQYTFLQNRYGTRYSADELMRRAMLEIVAMQANSESVEAEQAMRAEERRRAMRLVAADDAGEEGEMKSQLEIDSERAGQQIVEAFAGMRAADDTSEEGEG